MRQWLGRVWPYFAFTAVVALLYRQQIFGNLILGRGDAYLYFSPYWQLATDALRAGRLPLWNPDLFMGAPLLANSQVGLLYPPNWPLWLLFEPPQAIAATLVLHTLIAGWGTIFLARHALKLKPDATFLAALLFAGGGLFIAQAEHINQIQGLAWLPWLLAISIESDLRLNTARRIGLLGLLFGLQLLAGHAQVAFISGVTLLLWQATYHLQNSFSRHNPFPKKWLKSGLILAAAVLLAIFLAAAQLLPTLELTGFSRRQGGLPTNEALSFSLHPLLAARTLLPALGQVAYVEYIAFLPIAALLLALLGAAKRHATPHLRAIQVLILGGLFLAFGLFNPIYSFFLVRLPGFNLFRVPARWLILYALGMALAAAVGWDGLRRGQKLSQKGIGSAGLALIALIGVAFVSARLGRDLPMPPEAPAEMPTQLSLLLWAASLALSLALLAAQRRYKKAVIWLLPLILLSTLLATDTLTQQRLAPPQSYTEIRPSVARLQAWTAVARAERRLPDRFLSMSQGFFDPGDSGEIETIFRDQLTDAAYNNYITSTKQRQIVVPNLGLSYGLASVDGFDGGVLPTRAFTQVADLLLPPERHTLDGRLREAITAVPDARWLDLFNIRYLITDKVGDEWRHHNKQAVFFDTQHPATLAASDTATVGNPPAFAADGLWLLTELGSSAGEVTLTAGDHQFTVQPQQIAPDLFNYHWDKEIVFDEISVAAPTASALKIRALALIANSSHAFQPVLLGNYRLLHSGDVKIYENTDVLPRVYWVDEWVSAETITQSVKIMAQPDFDPANTAVVIGLGEQQGQGIAAKIDVISVSAERIQVKASAPSSGLLIFTDANYPGWEAILNGQPIPIYTTNGLFKAVQLPAGEHQLIFSFHAPTYERGKRITTITIFALGLLIFQPISKRMAKQQLPNR